MDARHKHTTLRAPSEMVAWWTPERRLLGPVGTGNLVRSVSLDFRWRDLADED